MDATRNGSKKRKSASRRTSQDCIGDPPARKRRIAIIGKAPSSCMLAPYQDETWEVWILNTLGFANEVPRWDRQYELHDIELTKDPAYGGYFPWLQAQEKPVWTRDGDTGGFKNAQRYPLAGIQKCFGDFAGRKYLTNTVSLMVAHALYEHAQGQQIEAIGLWGVDMAQQAPKNVGNAAQFSNEYAAQRPSVEYWIGVANGMGIHVSIPPQSDILKCSVIYGYHTTDKQKKWEARRNELRQRIAGAQQRERQSHDEAVFLSGAYEGMNYEEQWEVFDAGNHADNNGGA